MSPRWPFTIAHAVKAQERVYVHVYRTNRRGTLARALTLASAIRRHGYLVWIEQSGVLATR